MKRTNPSINLIAFLALFAFIGLPGSNKALEASTPHDDDDQRPRTIRVTGQGKSSATPDMATVNTGVVTQADTAGEALTQNSEAISNIMAQLKKQEVADKDMQTSRFSVQPVYERGQRGQQKPNVIGYRVSNQIRVRVRDLDRLGGLLDQLVQAGSNQISGISFGVDDSTKVINEARVDAVEDAKMRAELYAKTAGVAVGKVLSIDEGQIGIPRPVMYGAAMESRSVSVPVAAGEQDFSATITITFELEDK